VPSSRFQDKVTTTAVTLGVFKSAQPLTKGDQQLLLYSSMFLFCIGNVNCQARTIKPYPGACPTLPITGPLSPPITQSILAGYLSVRTYPNSPSNPRRSPMFNKLTLLTCTFSYNPQSSSIPTVRGTNQDGQLPISSPKAIIGHLRYLRNCNPNYDRHSLVLRESNSSLCVCFS